MFAFRGALQMWQIQPFVVSFARLQVGPGRDSFRWAGGYLSVYVIEFVLALLYIIDTQQNKVFCLL